MSVAEALGEGLARLGVAHAFGLVGSGNFFVASALARAGAAFVSSRHEAAAVSMADGYARVRGTVGVACVHQGPGFTNTLTALTEAAKARTPLLLLAADTPARALHVTFRIDQAAFAAAAGAATERLHSPETALDDAARAWRRAQVERRPVVLSMPLDVLAAKPPAGARLEPAPPPAPPRPAPEAVAAAADLVERAQRPAIIAGRGAVLARARPALERLGDRIGAVLATSAQGHGLFAGNPYGLGIAGGFATPLAARLLPTADLVLAFGASLNYWTTRHGALVGPAARVVQVDVDAGAIGRHRRVDVGVVGDAASAALALDEELARRGHAHPGFRGGGLAEQVRRSRWRDQPYEDAGTEAAIDPRTFTIALDGLLPAERAVAVDSGHFMGWPPMYLSVPDPAGFVFTQAFQSIGLGLASAIGAAVARPDRLTVAAVGDGGLLMALGELETAARLRLPLLVAVYNDAAYGAEVHHFGPMGAPLDLVRFPDTDFAAVARSLGAEGVTVRSRADLAPVAAWLQRRDRPLVIDAKVNPQVRAGWLAEAFRAG